MVEDGLELLAPIEADARELFVTVDENREYLREWLPWLDDVNSVEDELAMIRRIRDDKNFNWVYLIRKYGELVGVVSLNWGWTGTIGASGWDIGFPSPHLAGESLPSHAGGS